MSKEYPKCHVCGVELAEAWRLKRINQDPLYLCNDCIDILSAVTHDFSVSVFADITNILQSNVKPAVTWKPLLDLIEFGDDEEE